MTSSDRETLNSFGLSLRENRTDLSPRQKNYLLDNLNYREIDQIVSTWRMFSHAHQTPPDLAPNGKPWHTWLMIGGRGAGKTRSGAEWIRAGAGAGALRNRESLAYRADRRDRA
jgi:phage terminase large subunit-like protein